MLNSGVTSPNDLQKGVCILLYQESKGPARAFAAEIIHVEDNKAKIAIFHPQEDFRIISVEMNDRILTGPRDTYLEIRVPNSHEKATVNRVRQTVMDRLTDAERRHYENPADSGKKKRVIKEPETVILKPAKKAAKSVKRVSAKKATTKKTKRKNA